jgi:acyl-CoA dehydrogenase
MSFAAALDWPFFAASHRAFAPGFHDWVMRELAPFAADEGQDGVAAREIFQRLGRAQWLRATVARAPGEPPDRLDLRHLCLMRERLGYSSAIADVALSEPWLAALPIALYGTPEQRARYLVPYEQGRWLPAFALSEPDAGSDVAATATRATPTDRGYVLDGRKT